jgi:hypothetical protein
MQSASAIVGYGGTWVDVPTNLNNITDNNYTSVSSGAAGGFARTSEEATDLSYIVVTLPVVYYIQNITMKVGHYSFSGSLSEVDLKYSIDGISWTSIMYFTVSSVTEQINQSTYQLNASVRYLRSSVWNVPGTSYVRWYEIQANISDKPGLISPANNSIQYKQYPPLNADLNFTWTSNVNNLSSNLIIAKDSNFNLISVDTTIANNYSVQSLEAGNYWWKARYYNSTSGLYSPYSNTSFFTLTNNYTSSGKAGVEGVVYEMNGALETPISGATVHLYNASLSMSMITGANGYYLFDNLTNSTTYSVYAEKQGYDTTAAFPFTTGLGTRTQKNILVKAYISPYVPNFVYEKFVVSGLFGNPYHGVTATVYKGSDITAYLTGTTDSMGQVVFQLIKDQYYRVTFSGGGLPNTITVYVYGKEETYFVKVVSGFPDTGNRDDDISANLTAVTANATHTNPSVIYLDNKSSTTVLNFYVKNLTTGAYVCTKTSALQSVTLSCPVLSQGVYIFGYNATSTIYGTFYEDQVINFGAGAGATPATPTGINPTLLHWASISLLILLASVFSIRTVKYGVILIPFTAAVLWWMTWLQVNIILISIACVLGVLIYLRMNEDKVVV